VVFVHGILVDSRLWEPAADLVVPYGQTVLVDLPLGTHAAPVPDRSKLTLGGVASALLQVIDAVTDGPVVLVGNDTGGAVAQVATAVVPERVAGLVLTPCEVFQHTPPRFLKPLQSVLGIPGVAPLVPRVLGVPALFQRPGRLNVLTDKGFPADLVEDWLRPSSHVPEVLDDVLHLFRSAQPSDTLDAARALEGWDGQAAVVWATDDFFFPPEHGKRIAAHLDADPLTWVPDANLFCPGTGLTPLQLPSLTCCSGHTSEPAVTIAEAPPEECRSDHATRPDCRYESPRIHARSMVAWKSTAPRTGRPERYMAVTVGPGRWGFIPWLTPVLPGTGTMMLPGTGTMRLQRAGTVGGTPWRRPRWIGNNQQPPVIPAQPRHPTGATS
jgi:pimeloyl-ACP methyl ester carboxylesterase